MKARFSIIDLQLLVNIGDEQSLTSGAERSHLSLSSASIRIKMLEESIGTKLLNRSKLGTTLTPAGTTVLNHARIVLRQIEKIKGELLEYTSGVKGQVRLVANATSIGASLSEVLRRYLAQNPSVDVDLRECISDDGVRAVTDGAADIAIVAGDTHIDRLETLPYGSEELVLVTALDHRLARRKSVDFSETLEYSYVALQEGSALRQFILRQAHDHHADLDIRIQVGDFEAISKLVESNVGIGILPLSAALQYSRTAAMRIVTLNDAWATRQSIICMRSRELLPNFGQKLVSMLTERNPQHA